MKMENEVLKALEHLATKQIEALYGGMVGEPTVVSLSITGEKYTEFCFYTEDLSIYGICSLISAAVQSIKNSSWRGIVYWRIPPELVIYDKQTDEGRLNSFDVVKIGPKILRLYMRLLVSEKPPLLEHCWNISQTKLSPDVTTEDCGGG